MSQDLTQEPVQPEVVDPSASPPTELSEEQVTAGIEQPGKVMRIAEVLAPDLKEELERLSTPFGSEAPSDAELRIAHAQLIGWLEGLFHGIQAMLWAQQQESRARFEELRRRSLPAPEDPSTHPGGQYL